MSQYQTWSRGLKIAGWLLAGKVLLVLGLAYAGIVAMPLPLLTGLSIVWLLGASLLLLLARAIARRSVVGVSEQRRETAVSHAWLGRQQS